MNSTGYPAERTNGLRTLWFLVLLFLVISVITGCKTFGPRNVPQDRFNYNQALAESSRDQMLLNIVRLRYLEEPFFLTISSILTQYVYGARGGLGGVFGFDGESNGGTADVNLAYEERPTITYLPIEGREFSAHLLSSIPAELFFAAAQEGWSVDILMQIGMQRIGAVENMSFEAIPPSGEIERRTHFQRDIQKLKRFKRTVRLLTILADAEVFEVSLTEKDGFNVRHLVFEQEIPENMQPLVTELRQLLGLSNRDTFRITDRLTRTAENEISIQTRSVMAMMSFLSRGIEVPPEHLAEGRIIDYQLPQTNDNEDAHLIPFKMYWSKERPEKSFAAVRYQDYWFYIDNTDITSKRSLSLMIAIFRLQAPSGGGAAPILSLPTG